MLFSHLEQSDDVRVLLGEVFQMWVAIRMESQSEHVCGEETLGMQPQLLDEEVDTFGTVSIPPIMSAQIELLTTRLLETQFLETIMSWTLIMRARPSRQKEPVGIVVGTWLQWARNFGNRKTKQAEDERRDHGAESGLYQQDALHC